MVPPSCRVNAFEIGRSPRSGKKRALARAYQRRNRASIRPAAKAQTAVIIPTPSKINFHDQPLMPENRDLAFLRPDDPIGVDELGT